MLDFRFYMINNSKYFFFLYFLFFINICFSQQTGIAIPAQEIELETLVFQLENEYDLLFTYKQKDVTNIKVLTPGNTMELKAFLAAILKETDLEYELVNERFVLLTKKENVGQSDDLEENLLLLCGTIKDKFTGESLPSANVYLQNLTKGTTTSVDGTFGIKIRPDEQSDTLIVSYVGYGELHIPIRSLINKPCASISLGYYDFGENFLVVTEYLTDGILLGEHGAYTQLEPDKTGTLPGQVEPDVLNSIHFLPGVSSQDGTPSGISVQGGTPDQNLILWEGIPIYQSAHYFGTLSAFNPYAIDKVIVYKGDFGAEYGGRISSVIKLESVTDDQEDFNIGVGTNLIYSFIDGQIATENNKLSAVFSVRRSMTELWRSPRFENITKRVQQGILVQNIDLNNLPSTIRINDDFSFFDTNLKLNYQLTDKDKLSVAGFYADNSFEDLILDDTRMQAQSDTFDSQNSGLNLSWNRQWKPRLSTNVNALYTDYHYNYGFSLLTKGNNQSGKIGEKHSAIQEKQLHISSQLTTKKEHLLKIGYQLTNYDVNYKIVRNSIQDGTGVGDFLSNLHVLYTGIQTNNEKKYGASLGLRLNYFQELEKTYLEPRVRFWYQPNEQINLYASGGKYYQYLSQIIQLEGDQASIQTPVWGLTGTRLVPVLNANHFQVGMVFSKNTWLIDLEVYAKNVTGLTSLASGFDEGISNRAHLGDAKIKGVDLLVKKRWNNYKTWVSYALRKVDHHFPTFFDTDFPANIDQRHSFKWANMWTIGAFECSLGWSISSGRPFSNRMNFQIVPSMNNSTGPRELVIATVNSFNDDRLPAEHQLDVSFLYRFRSKKRDRLNGLIGWSVYNVYNQKNILSRDFFIDNRPGMASKLAYNDGVNMGVTPSFVIRLEW